MNKTDDSYDPLEASFDKEYPDMTGQELFVRFQYEVVMGMHSVEREFRDSQAKDEIYRRGKIVLVDIANSLEKYWLEETALVYLQNPQRERSALAIMYLLCGLAKTLNIKAPYNKNTVFSEQSFHVWLEFLRKHQSPSSEEVVAVYSSQDPINHPVFMRYDRLVGTMSHSLQQLHAEQRQMRAKASDSLLAITAEERRWRIRVVGGIKLRRDTKLCPGERKEHEQELSRLKQQYDHDKLIAESASTAFNEIARDEFPALRTCGHLLIFREDKIGWNTFPVVSTMLFITRAN